MEEEYQVKEWSKTELKILDQIMEEAEEDITFLSDIQLTGNNILALYSVENISSKYQVSSKIEQKSRMIANYLSMAENCQFNIIFIKNNSKIKRRTFEREVLRFKKNEKSRCYWSYKIWSDMRKISPTSVREKSRYMI